MCTYKLQTCFNFQFYACTWNTHGSFTDLGVVDERHNGEHFVFPCWLPGVWPHVTQPLEQILQSHAYTITSVSANGRVGFFFTSSFKVSQIPFWHSRSRTRKRPNHTQTLQIHRRDDRQERVQTITCALALTQYITHSLQSSYNFNKSLQFTTIIHTHVYLFTSTQSFQHDSHKLATNKLMFTSQAHHQCPQNIIHVDLCTSQRHVTNFKMF